MATENSDTDGNQLTCGICIENYKTPRYLPTCGHTFCEICLLTHASNLQQQGSKLECPVCRKPQNFPEDAQVTREWVQRFPLNTVMIKIMDAGSESPEQKITEAEVRRECDPCKERGETVVGLKFCMDCQEVYCKTCTDFHKAFKKLKDHRLIDIREVSAKVSRADFFTSFTKCPNHPDKEAEVYCKDHAAVFCIDCFNSTHKLCSTYVVSNHASDAAKLTEESEELMSQMRYAVNHLNRITTIREENKKDLDKQLKEIRESVEKMRDQVVTLMDNVVSRVSEVTKQIELENEDKLDKDISRVSEIKLLTEEKVALLETIRQHGSERHQFISAVLMKTQMEELDRKISEEDKRLKKIDVELTVADDIRKLIGNTDIKKLAHVTVNESESRHRYLNAGTNYLRDSKLVRVEEHTARRDVDCKPRYRGIAVCKDGRVILSEFDSKYMCLYNPANKTMLQLQLNNSTSATQIDDTHIAISIPRDKAISIVTVGNELRVEKTTKTPYKPSQIVALTNGQLAVAWRDPSAFGVIDINGTDIVQKSYFDQDTSGRKFDSFYYLAIDEKRNHVIQPVCKTKSVYCFDFSGEPVFKYSDPGLIDIRGVALDKCGNIYVCSCAIPGSIHKLSPTGEKIAIIKEGIPHNPWGICSDNSGTGFWMTNVGVSLEKIKYFRLEQNTWTYALCQNICYVAVAHLTVSVFNPYATRGYYCQPSANSVDPDQTASNSPSDQGPHCSLLISISSHIVGN